MSTNSDFDRLASAWLADGPTELSDRVLADALREVHLAPQRRRWSMPWRASTMRTRSSTAVAIAVIALAGVLGTAYIGGLGPSPSPTSGIASAAPSSTPRADVDTSSWTPFTSRAFGYDARYPLVWLAHPALSSPPTAQITPPDSVDSFEERDEPFGSLIAWSVRVPAGMSDAQWSAAYVAAVADATGDACYPPSDSWESIQIDGRAAWLYHGCSSWVESVVFAGGRAYVFAATAGASAANAPIARQNLLAFVSTVRLSPGAVVTASPTEAAIDTGGWILFVSAKNWLGIKFPRGWTSTPAEHTWRMPADAAWPTTGADRLTSPDGRIVVAAWSVLNPDSLTLEAWIDAYCPLATSPCVDATQRAAPIVADPDARHAGLRIGFDDSVQAFFLDGDRIYAVAIWNAESDPATGPYGGTSHLLEAFALSMCFDCASPAGSTARPG